MKNLIFLFLVFLFFACKNTMIKDNKNNIFDSLENQEITEQILTPELLWKFGRLEEYDVSPDGNYIVYSVKRFSINHNKGFSDLYLIDLNSKVQKKLTNLPGNENNPVWNPKNNKVGFIYSSEDSTGIYEIDIHTYEITRIKNLPEDIESFIYSPKGNYILFTKRVKIDKSIQEIYPDLPKSKAYIAEDLMFRHWDAWHDGTYMHVFIAKLKDNTVQDIQDILENEPYESPMSPFYDIKEVNWSPDEKYVAYTCKKLKGKYYSLSTNSDIYIYNIETKKTENISNFNYGYDKYPVFSSDGKYLVWMQMKTPGYESDKMNLVLYNLQTKETKILTNNFDYNAYNYVFSSDCNKIYFISDYLGTKQIFFVDLKNLNIRQLTSGIFDINEIKLGNNCLIAKVSSMKMSNELFRVNLNSGDMEKITDVNKKIYEKIKLGEVRGKWVKTIDNKNMLVWYVYPPNFDSTKKYPAILYCQGGPQSMVSQFFSYRWNFQLMAANNYIVVAPNRRGVPGFGYEWLTQISGDYYGLNMQDYLTAIDDACNLPYVDKNKLACVGASYGGFSVFWLAGNHNKRFKAFIAHCGMFNLESMYCTTDELFFVNYDFGGPFWDKKNITAQKTFINSPHKFVQNWDTPILITTGENDFRVPYTESIQAFTCAQLLNIPSKLIVFPNENHFILKPQNSILWQREFFNWLNLWLNKSN